MMQKSAVSAFIILCLEMKCLQSSYKEFHIGFSQLEDHFLSVKEISYFNNI